MIDLQFFGRGAGFNPVEGNTNAYLICGRDLLLIDCGESTFSSAVEYPGLEGWASVTVLMTHLHADHSGSLASFCSYNYFVLKRKVLVAHPVPTVIDLLRLQGVNGDVYTYQESLPEHFGISVRALPVKHASDMACFGYYLWDEDETIYYSGDSAEFPDEVAKRLASGELARVYHDLASRPSSTHCPASAAEALVPLSLRSKIWAMHLDSDCERDFRARGFSVVEVAKNPQIVPCVCK